MSSITSEAISQIKNLGKIVEKVGILQSTDSNSKFPNWLLDVLEYSPFWINDPKEHEVAAENTQGYCCFNHILGETIKYGKPNPLYPFQTDIIIPAYEKHDAIWILKATGLGVTEISLRYMMWKAITGERNKYYRSIMPNLSL